MIAVIEVNEEHVPVRCELYKDDSLNEAIDCAVEIATEHDPDLDVDQVREELTLDGWMYVGDRCLAIMQHVAVT